MGPVSPVEHDWPDLGRSKETWTRAQSHTPLVISWYGTFQPREGATRHWQLKNNGILFKCRSIKQNQTVLIHVIAAMPKDDEAPFTISEDLGTRLSRYVWYRMMWTVFGVPNCFCKLNEAQWLIYASVLELPCNEVDKVLWHMTGLNLGLLPANARRVLFVTTSVTGWVQA